MTYNPALDLPLTPTPHTLVMTVPGYVYYHQFPIEPSWQEYQAAVLAVGDRMAKELGVVPSSEDSVYRPSNEIRWDVITAALQSEPVRVQ